MSTPYSTAVAFIYGKAGLKEFGAHCLTDSTVKALTQKVEVVSDEEMSRIFPEKQSAILTVMTHGNTYSERVDFPKGEPENPMTEEEFRGRYEDLMVYGQVDKAVFEAVYDMVNQPNVKVSELIKDL